MNRGGPGPASRPALAAHGEPISAETLASLYANHGKYVSQVARVNEENFEDGDIVYEDTEATIEEAAHSGIGKKK